MRLMRLMIVIYLNRAGKRASRQRMRRRLRQCRTVEEGGKGSWQLVKDADIIAHNVRKGLAARLDFGCAAVRPAGRTSSTRPGTPTVRRFGLRG